MFKKYYQQNKPFLAFLLKFFVSYLLLIFVYNLYLKDFSLTNRPDGFTQLVANQAAFGLEKMGFIFTKMPSKADPSVVYLVNNVPFVRIIEGCNAMSVMILFVAFVVAFSGKLVKTIVFLFLGVFTIHFLNVGRIVLLTLGLFHYPEYKTILHDIVFPLFIYGVVFGLWVLWVTKFSNYAIENKK